MSDKRCGRCNRILKDSNCIEVGYGKSCYRKLFSKPFPKRVSLTKVTTFRGSRHRAKSEKSLQKEIPPLFMEESVDEKEDIDIGDSEKFGE